MTTLYNTSSQTVAANGTIGLTTVRNQKGCSTKSATNGITINRPGIYQIVATITGLVTGGGTINLAVKTDTGILPDLIGAAYTNTAQPETITLVGTYIVNPNCCSNTNNVPTTISLINNGTAANVLSFASLNVTKIDC